MVVAGRDADKLPRLRRGDDDVTEILSLEEGVRLTGQHPIELGVADADGFAGW